MKNITITKENLLKAHSEGCEDTKKVLETLCPDEFEDKYDSDKIYAICKSDKIYVIHKRDYNGSVFHAYDGKANGNSINGHGKESFDSLCNIFCGNTINSFDTQKDFFTWALKTIS